MTSRHARFSEAIPPVTGGTAKARSRNYVKYCGKGSVQNSGWDSDRSVVGKCGKGWDAYITAYCGDDLHDSVNTALANDNEAGLRKHGQYIHGLRVALLRRINDGENVTSGVVYRWMEHKLDHIAQYKKGFKFLWPRFASTSWKPNLRKANVRFEIDLDGVGVTYAIDVRKLSPYRHEEEVLFYPYSGFEVLSVEQRNNVHYIKLRTYDTLRIDSFFGQDDMDPDADTAVSMP